MTMALNIDKILDSITLVGRRCTEVGGRPIDARRNAWLFDSIIRNFDAIKSAVAITYDCQINLVGKGQFDIYRDGTLVMRSVEE